MEHDRDDEYALGIDVAARYLDDQSEPERDRYVFAYTIHIRNTGAVPARLLGRHWVITDANGKVEEVVGDGVVGEQPLLDPGESFEYTSGAVLETDLGTMRGSYDVLADDGTRFAAVVRAAFGQRRKTLRNALGSLMDAAAIEAAGLRPDARAEQVPVDGFVRLANLPATGTPASG